MNQDGDVAALRQEADAAISRHDAAAALAALGLIWRRHRGPSTAAFVNARMQRIDGKGHVPATIAILRSFTTEPIVPLLSAAGAVNGLELTVHTGDFNTYFQELIDPTGSVYAEWSPDVVVLAVQTRDIAPELWGLFTSLSAEAVEAIGDRVAGEFEAMISAFRRMSPAALLIHGLELPQRPALGIADRSRSTGQIAAIEQINARLTSLAAATIDVFVLDYDGLVARAGRLAWYDERKWQTMRMPIRSDHLGDVADEWLRYIHPLTGRVAKALVVDLDNTLWGGVIGEDGIDGIELSSDGVGAGYAALQRAIADLSARGILLAICSKNNEDEARQAFETHPQMVLKWSDFSAVRANWESKADNLRSIAGELNIGLDAVAFLDDNPAECELIRQQLPEVIVIDLDVVPTVDSNPIVGNPFFERLRLTQEDVARRMAYEQQRERIQFESSVGSMDQYLRSLGMTVAIEPMQPNDVVRVSQLTQKTNQFNVSTHRYPEAAIAVSRSDRLIYTTRATDRFGDHGLIGVTIVDIRGPEWEIDTLLLSCRVIGRGVETAMLARVMSDAADAEASSIIGQFVPTAKNAPAGLFFERHGFVCVDQQPDRSMWRFDLADGLVSTPDWIALRSTAEGVQ